MFSIQWPLVLFGLICGLGGTLGAAAAVAELMGKARQGRFVASVVALVLLVVGGCTVLLHITLPQNVFYAVTNLASLSGISVEIIMIAITFVLVGAYAIMLKREVPDAARKAIAILALISGVVLAFVCGHGYVIDSRPYWDTNLMPLAYLGSVLPAGAFLYLVIAGKLGAGLDELKALKPYVIATVVVSIVTTVLYLVTLGGEVLARNVVCSYGLVVACGIVGELVCLYLYLTAKDVKTVVVAAVVGLVLAVLCALGVRFEMWLSSDPFFDAFSHEVGNGTPIGTDDY